MCSSAYSSMFLGSLAHVYLLCTQQAPGVVPGAGVGVREENNT